jgi:hypothetical protein
VFWSIDACGFGAALLSGDSIDLSTKGGRPGEQKKAAR